MQRVVSAVLSGVAVLILAGCGARADLTYKAPMAEVHDKLAKLDLGDRVDSAVFRMRGSVPASGSESSQAVVWHVAQGGADVIAHLEAIGSTETGVTVSVVATSGGDGVVDRGFASSLIRPVFVERIASYLEDRKYDDSKVLHAGYAGTLVPQSYQDQAMEALRRQAAEQDAEDNRRAVAPFSTSPEDTEYAQQKAQRDATKPMVDLSRYNRR